MICSPTSRRWAWFPPEARINTGRLRSAGSGWHPVPRRPRYFAALRLPRLVGHGFGSPRLRPTSMRTLFYTARRAVRRHTGVGEGVTGFSVAPVSVEENEGLPGAWAVLFLRAVVQDPAGCESLLAHLAERPPSSSDKLKPWTPGMIPPFEANHPRPTCSRAYASPIASPPTAQGSLPARAGSPLAGRVSHPLDDKRSFMETSQPPFLFDQPCLVAPISLDHFSRPRCS